MKIVIHGLGKVGSTLAYTVLLKGLASELVLISRNQRKAEGDALDLRQSTAFNARPTRVTAGTVEAAADADIIVLCALGPHPARTHRPQRPGRRQRPALRRDHPRPWRRSRRMPCSWSSPTPSTR